MRLPLEVRTAYFEAFGSAYPALDDLRVLLSQYLNKRLQDYVTSGATVPVAHAELLEKAEAGGWELELIRRAAEHRAQNAKVQALAQMIQDHPNTSVTDHYEVRLMYGRNPVLGRKEMRRLVKNLGDPTKGVRIGVVSGEPESGKSFTEGYIAYIHANLNGFDLARVNLNKLLLQSGGKEGEKDVVKPEDVAEEIALQLGLDGSIPRRKEEQAARWARIFGAWLTGKLQNRPRPQWIVIDGCRVFMNGEVGFLLRELADRVAVTLPDVRLVLLHCSQDDLLPDKIVLDSSDEEVIQPISSEDLHRLFLFVHKEAAGEEPPAPDVLDDHALTSTARVLNELTQKEDKGLEQLSLLVQNEVAAIRAGELTT